MAGARHRGRLTALPSMSNSKPFPKTRLRRIDGPRKLAVSVAVRRSYLDSDDSLLQVVIENVGGDISTAQAEHTRSLVTTDGKVRERCLVEMSCFGASSVDSGCAGEAPTVETISGTVLGSYLTLIRGDEP